MKIPFENYVKTCVAARKTPDLIQDELREMGLLMMESDINDMYQHLYLEQPEYFDDFSEPVDIDWLEHHNIDKMFGYLFDHQIRRNLNGIEGAFKIYEDAQIHRIVTSMAMSGFGVEDIELLIQGKLDVNYEYEDFKEFINYFFNLEGWTKKDKERYIGTIKNSDLKRAYKEAILGDKNKLLWKLKLSPKLEFEEMLREISYDSFYKFKELLAVDPEMALKFAGTVEKVTGRLEKIVEERKSDEGAKHALDFIFEEESRESVKSYAELKREEED